MRVKVVIYPKLEILTKELKGKSRLRVKELISMLGYREWEVIVCKYSEILALDDYVFDGDVIHIYEVVSTG